MQFEKKLIAGALLSASAGLACAQSAPAAATPKSADATQAKALPSVTVTSSPFGSSEGDQILTPAKVLAGDELRDKLGSSLGDTLSHELGVSSSAFGAGAARPIIRGLEGARVKVLENGMAVGDVSGLSNDHAVATDGPTARQIEILRGPAALLYGSDAIGGLVNVVNERIPVTLEPRPTGEAALRYGSVDRARNGSLSVDGSAGRIAVHVDGSVRNADDYRTPDGRLPWTFTRQHGAGLGASLVDGWGHVGMSVSTLSNLYGVPTVEGGQIDQQQTRYDLDGLVKAPAGGIEQVKFKLGYNDYQHSELAHDRSPLTTFTNHALESRIELAHAPINGWHGSLGLQTENTRFAGVSNEGGIDTVPRTRSTANAVFLVEEHDFAGGKMNAGIRYEEVKRNPERGRARQFGLTSWSAGASWPLGGEVSLGLTASAAQRAPATEELYSAGPHESTGTFDFGDENFRRETSDNVELTLQKTSGLWRWKANAFYNRIKDYIFGEIFEDTLDEAGLPGGEFRTRHFRQSDATIRGLEAELGYNQSREGFSWRLFGDFSRGRLNEGGNLPLQPAARYGADLLYRAGAWRAGLSALHAQRMDRLASFESTPTPAYTQVDASLAWTQRLEGDVALTWFAQAKNLLNQDIRLSTSILKDVAPMPGRGLVVGVRSRF